MRQMWCLLKTRYRNGEKWKNGWEFAFHSFLMFCFVFNCLSGNAFCGEDSSLCILQYGWLFFIGFAKALCPNAKPQFFPCMFIGSASDDSLHRCVPIVRCLVIKNSSKKTFSIFICSIFLFCHSQTGTGKNVPRNRRHWYRTTPSFFFSYTSWISFSLCAPQEMGMPSIRPCTHWPFSAAAYTCERFGAAEN